VATARNPEAVWERVGELQQAALEETLANLKPKRVRRPKPPPPPPTGAADASAAHTENNSTAAATPSGSTPAGQSAELNGVAALGDASHNASGDASAAASTPNPNGVSDAAKPNGEAAGGEGDASAATPEGGAAGGAAKATPKVKCSPAQRKNQALLADVPERVVSELVNATVLKGTRLFSELQSHPREVWVNGRNSRDYAFVGLASTPLYDRGPWPSPQSLSQAPPGSHLSHLLSRSCLQVSDLYFAPHFCFLMCRAHF
jgi:hypothetical protein